jgi:hypothetical protein
VEISSSCKNKTLNTGFKNPKKSEAIYYNLIIRMEILKKLKIRPALSNPNKNFNLNPDVCFNHETGWKIFLSLNNGNLIRIPGTNYL